MHAHDGEWPDLTEAGRLERLAFADRWSDDAGRVRRRGPGPRRASRPRPRPDGARRAPVRRDGAPPGGLGPARVGLPPRRRALPAARPRVRPAGRPAGLDGGPPGRDPGARRGGPDRARLPARPTGFALPRRDGAQAAARDRRAGRRRRPRRRGGRPGRSGRGRPDAPPRRRRGDARAAPSTSWRSTCATWSCPASEGEGRLGPALFATKMRHTLKDDELTPARILERAERESAAVRAEMIRIARELWPTWCPGRDRPRRRRPRWSGTVLDAIAAEHQPAGRPARLVPRGARPDRGLLPRSRPGGPGRGSAGDPLDARLPARLRRGDARLARPPGPGPEGVLRDHPDPRRLVSPSRPRATSARTTTGCSGS